MTSFFIRDILGRDDDYDEINMSEQRARSSEQRRGSARQIDPPPTTSCDYGIMDTDSGCESGTTVVRCDLFVVDDYDSARSYDQHSSPEQISCSERTAVLPVTLENRMHRARIRSPCDVLGANLAPLGCRFTADVEAAPSGPRDRETRLDKCVIKRSTASDDEAREFFHRNPRRTMGKNRSKLAESETAVSPKMRNSLHSTPIDDSKSGFCTESTSLPAGARVHQNGDFPGCDQDLLARLAYFRLPTILSSGIYPYNAMFPAAPHELVTAMATASRQNLTNDTVHLKTAPFFRHASPSTSHLPTYFRRHHHHPYTSETPSSSSNDGVDVEDGKAKKCRRSRTVFTELQMLGLEKRFEKQQYLSTPDRVELAEILGLSQLQVKTWYQNRRMKWKKQVLQCGATEAPTKPKGRPRKIRFDHNTSKYDDATSQFTPASSFVEPVAYHAVN